MSVAAIAFTPAPLHESPNFRAKSQDPSAAYYASMLVAFASIARWDDACQLCLVTDAPVPREFEDPFRRMSVKILEAPFAHRPPQGFTGKFAASLYSIDAMAALTAAFPNDRIALLDPDCLAVRPVTEMLNRHQELVGVYPTQFAADHVSNGLTAREAAELHTLLDPALNGLPTHFGGECYVFTSASLGAALPRALRAYEFSLLRASQGLSHFVTEEHLLNYALRYAQTQDLTGFVRRIWTAPTFRNVQRADANLVLWHLPAEKDRGIPRLQAAVRDRGSWFWRSDPITYRRRLGAYFGIPRRNPRRWAYDSSANAVRRIQQVVHSAR